MRLRVTNYLGELLNIEVDRIETRAGKPTVHFDSAGDDRGDNDKYYEVFYELTGENATVHSYGNSPSMDMLPYSEEYKITLS